MMDDAGLSGLAGGTAAALASADLAGLAAGGGGHGGHGATGSCLNCNTVLVPGARFCSQCGQDTANHPPSLFEFVHEFVSHYIAVEGTLWKSLWGLMARPGFLTQEYLAGRKQRYVLPLRLLLTLGLRSSWRSSSRRAPRTCPTRPTMTTTRPWWPPALPPRPRRRPLPSPPRAR